MSVAGMGQQEQVAGTPGEQMSHRACNLVWGKRRLRAVLRRRERALDGGRQQVRQQSSARTARATWLMWSVSGVRLELIWSSPGSHPNIAPVLIKSSYSAHQELIWSS